VDITEDELLAAIRRVLSVSDPAIVVPVGDDAAVVREGAGDLVLTTDTVVEGVHVDLATATPRDIGYKAVAVTVSDLAAMASSPRFALSSLTLSADVDAAWTMELFGGMREACDEFAVSLVGGNVSSAPVVSVTVMLTGEVAPGRAVTRAGAGPGDVVVVTGSLGGAAAGLRRTSDAVHGRNVTDEVRDAIRRHQRPTPRVGEAQVIARHGATAMIDVSDGLAIDVTRLCEASGVGVRLDLGTIPVHPAAAEGEALGGGEDYELIATMPSDAAASEAAAELREMFGVPLTTIGRITASGLASVDQTGTSRPLERRGWDHFA
jgi:thiamine-monophosphate kinase